ncbi:hypothetical protein, partial [Bacillus thuringiensis]|uniref:hypothetical protein n=1 Tax=Bacillus thuringiensis TaxID=1428 RepID=UPI00119FFB1C
MVVSASCFGDAIRYEDTCGLLEKKEVDTNQAVCVVCQDMVNNREQVIGDFGRVGIVNGVYCGDGDEGWMKKMIENVGRRSG